MRRLAPLDFSGSICCVLNVGRGHWEDGTVCWPACELELGKQRLRPHPLSLGNALPTVPPISTMGAIFKDTDNSVSDGAQWRPHYKILDSGGWVQGCVWSWLLKTNLIRKFCSLLNLPPTNLGCPTSFFHLSSSSVCGEQFQMSPRKLQRVRTNTGITVMNVCPCICTNSCIL